MAGRRPERCPGSPVAVVAGPGARWRLREAVTASDRAAEVADRFVAEFYNPQGRYRIYLADQSSWRRWFHVDSKPDVASLSSRSPAGRVMLANFQDWLIEGLAECTAFTRALVHGPDSPRSVQGVLLGRTSSMATATTPSTASPAYTARTG